MYGGNAYQVESGARGLLKGIVYRLEPHLQPVVEIGMTGAVARGVDVRIGRAAIRVYHDTVGAFEARSRSELVGRDNSDTDDDEIGGVLCAVLRHDRMHAAV